MRSLTAIAFALLAASAQAQVSEVIEVRVANVDVVVLDRTGKPITGLTKDDFQVFENGKPQALTNFYEMRSQTAATPEPGAAAPSPEARKRSIVIFFDETSVAPYGRNKALDSLDRALATLVRDGDDAMVIGWKRGVNVLQGFTSDRAALERAIAAEKKRVAEMPIMNAEKENVLTFAGTAIRESLAVPELYPMQKAYEDSMTTWETYADKVRASEASLLNDTSQLLSSLTGTDRKKVFLFVGGELPAQPGLDVLVQMTSMFDAQQNVRTTPAMTRTENIHRELRKLAETASADGVTMYVVDAGARPIDDNGADVRDPSLDFISDMNSLTSMGALAATTGGAILNGTKDFDRALKDVSRDLDAYYSLGYKPSEGPKQRKIVVKVNKPGARVRTREFYSLKTADEQISDAVVANVFHDGMAGDFGVSVAAGAAEAAEPGTYKVPVTITFPSDLTYLPEGEKMVGEYSVVFVTASPDGAMSPITKQVHKVSFPAARASEVGAQTLQATATLLVKKGTQSVSVAVVDRRGARSGYGKATFTAE